MMTLWSAGNYNFRIWAQMLFRMTPISRSGELSYNLRGLTVKEIACTSGKELNQVFRLRSEIYCDELKWVNEPENGKEYDVHDSGATFFGVFDKDGQLLGCSRILNNLPSESMLMREFRGVSLVAELMDIDWSKTIEVSRLAVRKDYRNIRFGSLTVSQHLYYLMYKWTLNHGKRFWTFEAKKNFIESLSTTLGIKVNILKGGKSYGGEEVYAAFIDLKKAKYKVILFVLFRSFLAHNKGDR